ncbi:MAG: hypothetical protein WCT99_03290 [Bacteroidota bacterium]|jgi:hypothetical protein
MIKIITVITTIIVFPFLYAQQPDSTFLHLNTGEKKFGKVEFKDPFLSRSYILFNDSTRYELKEVKAFQNSDGYFAKLPGRSARVVKRVIAGKVDFFSETQSYYHVGNSFSYNTPMGTMTSTTPGSFSTTTIEYFCKDGSELQDASYSNLRTALADNTKSMQLLDEYRTMNYFKYGIGTVGLAIIVAGITAKDGPSKNTVIAGAIVVNLAWIPSLMQGGKIDQAIRVYNQ